MLSKDAVQKIIITTLLILLFAALYIPLNVIINSARFLQVGQGDAPASGMFDK